jgi:D-alanine-D-alanine ligase
MKDNILLLINRLSGDPTSDEKDVLDQVEAVEKSLDELGFPHQREWIDLDLSALTRLRSHESGIICFNLVESLNQDGSLVYFIPALLESLHIPFTGNPSDALFLTTQKPLAKRLMQGRGIPTPAWFEASQPLHLHPDHLYIAKPAREDASVGITDENVFRGSDPQNLDHFRQRWGDQFFVEQYITGREFNLSIVEGLDGPEVLAPAEIRFLDFPPGKPAIVGYEAKWDPDTFEYQHTVRSFDFPESDQPLLQRLTHLCYTCWQVFNLRGYARVDFRVDQDDNPYVLEINANPCISPDSGFYQAVIKSGYTFTRIIERILNAT